MEHIVKLNQIVTGFAITEQSIDCMCGTDLMKIDKHSGEILYSKTIFEKEGLSRRLCADHGQIFIYDFCTLYVFDQDQYELVGKWQLGTDLSSDICGMLVNEQTIYCSMRNGRIITIDRSSYKKQEFDVSDSSMWSMIEYKSWLVCGTVDGKVLFLNKETCAIEKSLTLGTQNIRSLFIDHDLLYCSSQDKKLFKIELSSMNVEKIKRNVHKRMFECVGRFEDMLITISYPSSEIILWDMDTLEKKKEILVPLRLDGRTYLENDLLYLSSRNILGIDGICLSE